MFLLFFSLSPLGNPVRDVLLDLRMTGCFLPPPPSLKPLKMILWLFDQTCSKGNALFKQFLKAPLCPITIRCPHASPLQNNFSFLALLSHLRDDGEQQCHRDVQGQDKKQLLSDIAGAFTPTNPSFL